MLGLGSFPLLSVSHSQILLYTLGDAYDDRTQQAGMIELAASGGVVAVAVVAVRIVVYNKCAAKLLLKFRSACESQGFAICLDSLLEQDAIVCSTS